MMRSAITSVLMSLFVLTGAPAWAQQNAAPPAANAAVAAAENAQPSYRVLQELPDRLMVELPNGLIAVAQELHVTPVVTAQVWVKTGSIYEQQHVGAGLSHFLEHMVSGGTTSNRTEEENTQILGQIGAQTNASTSLDNVRYYITTTAPFAGDAVDLLSDWMQNSLIPVDEYKRERDVIQREFEMGQGEPGRIFWKLTQQARFDAHPARHPTIGYLDDFLEVTRDQLYDFYKQMYVPNNMVFVVTGDIDKEQIINQIAQQWAQSESRELPKLSFPIEPDLTQAREFSAKADVRRPRIRLAWPSTRLRAPGDYALDMLGVILGQGEASRLVQSVRDQQGLVSNIAAYNYSMVWAEGYFGIDAEIAAQGAPTPEHLATVKQAILDQVENVRKQGVTQEELASAQTRMLSYSVLSNQGANDIGSRLASDLINTGDPDYFERYAQNIKEITPADVQEAANRFLTSDRMITLTLLPLPEGEKAPVLERAEDKPDTAQLPREEVVLDNQAIVKQFERLAAEGKTQPTVVESDEVKRFVLPNGLRLLVGRSTHVPGVAVQYYTIGGLLADKPGQEGVNNAMASMLVRGTNKRGGGDLALLLDQMGASLSSSGGNNTWYVQGVALKDDWRKILSLLAEVVQEPAFMEEEWQTMQPRILAAIDRTRDRWNGELSSYFRDAYYGEHPWSQLTLGRRDVVQNLSAQDLRKYYQDTLSAGDAVLAVFGDVNPQEVLQAATELFGALPEQAQIPVTLPQPDVPTPVVKQITTSKPLTAVQIGFGPGATRSSPDYAALRVMSNILSSFPAGRLEQELRGRGPGLVYAVGAGANVGLVPGYFTVLFNTQAQVAPEAIERTLDVLSQIRTQKVDAQTLARAKAAVLTDEFTGQESNADRATDAALVELYGVSEEASEKFLETVQALTAEDIQAVANKYLRNPVAVVLTNESIDQQKLEQLFDAYRAEAAAAAVEEN